MKARQIRVLFILLSALLMGTATFSIAIPDPAIAGPAGCPGEQSLPRPPGTERQSLLSVVREVLNFLRAKAS
jgi:hypothetical protein